MREASRDKIPPVPETGIELGFKITDIDYVDGSGANRFEWDAALWGPYLAVSFHF